MDTQPIREFVNSEIVSFHDARLDRLRELKLPLLLRKKNPYLFRAKNLLTASQLIQSILDAFLSSSEEELFGEFLERLAIFVCAQTYGGRKSSAEGLDLEFDQEQTHYIVSIKSGPNWGNSSQHRRLEDNFRRAVTVQRQARSNTYVQPVLGICYGRTATKDTGDYIQYTGQSFWHFLSGDPNLYIEMIEPIGYQAKRHNDDFEQNKASLHNRLTGEFISEFCDSAGNIKWARLVAFNSANLS
jgi:hypothetical protein